MTACVPFTGSYTADDVEFLLKPMVLEDTPVAVKEALIQSGQKHYSQLLSHESLPAQHYLALFHEALRDNKPQLARHALILAGQIAANRRHGIALVSLARAGTPIGVLLKHLLKRYFNREAAHYSVSILRDVGLDSNALRHILKRHNPESLVFVDGWTGKGIIAKQLAESLARFAHSEGVLIRPELHVLTDLCGSAAVTASTEDYLIPSCILNATVSGLVSRTFYDPAYWAADDFHGCVFYQHFAGDDLSAYFVGEVLSAAAALWRQGFADALLQQPPNLDKDSLRRRAQTCISGVQQRYHVRDSHLIKPGIGESTRVLLRREARLLLLKQAHDPATRHLRWLAQARGVPSAVQADLPFHAIALIKDCS